jgi:cyclase
MRKQSGCWLCFFALLFVSVWAQGQSAPEIKVVPVSEKIYMLDGLPGTGNVAFLVTEQGVLVVDSGASPADGRTICEKVSETTGKPIRFVVLTHYHGDHTWGLQSFPADTLVIAQPNVKKNMQRYGEMIKNGRLQLPARIAALKTALGKLGKRKKTVRQKVEEDLKKAEEEYAFCRQLKIGEPHITLEGKMSFRLGEESVEITYPGPAHTDDNLLVHFPGQKVVHMGDMLFYRHHPYIDWQAGSNTANWITALKDVQTWPFEKVIPGHGPVAGKEALDEQIRYLTDLRDAVSAAMQKGLSLEQVKKTVALPACKDFGFPDMLPYAIEAVFNELSDK